MKVIRRKIDREEVIKFYVDYDRRKKHEPNPADLTHWPWDDPQGLDSKLREHGLKPGVVAAYKVWWFVELSVADVLECAIVNHVFEGHPQALSLLVLRGAIETWQPESRPEWFDPLSRGDAFPSEWAMILRPSLSTEYPAKWYIEDGSGRALCLLQRVLRHAEAWREAYGYLGVVPDQRSAFVQSRPELAGVRIAPAV